MLTADTHTPVVPKTTVRANLLESFQVLTKLVVQTVGEDLRVFAVHDVFLPVEEPVRNLVLTRVLDDGDNALELIVGKFSGAKRERKETSETRWIEGRAGRYPNNAPFIQVHVCLFADKIRVPPTDTLDGSEGVHDLPLPLDIGVEETQDVLESRLVLNDERLF